MYNVNLSTKEFFRESETYNAGSVAKIGCLKNKNINYKIGLTICYDLRFPNLFRKLALSGADIITVPSFFMHTTGKVHWHTLLKARAIETGCYIIAPAQIGSFFNQRKAYGHSLIISPWGKILKDAKRKEGIIIEKISLEQVKEARLKIPSLKMNKKMNVKKNENFFLSLFWIILIALIFRAFLFQSYNIPSGSMLKNLLVGDYIFVSKYAYGYSKHSLPFSIPIIPKRIFPSEPLRGDVVVFKLPSDGRTDYIKRVIGMPGDKVQILNGEVYINDKKLSYKEVGTYDDNNLINRKRKSLGCRNEQLKVIEETLPSGKKYNILDSRQPSYADNTGVYNVPKDHFFVMGDNRDNSQDSRYIKSVGFIPFDNLVGRAELIFFSWNWRKIGQTNCKTSVEWKRVLKRIK